MSLRTFLSSCLIVGLLRKHTSKKISVRANQIGSHFHVRYLDGVYVEHPAGAVRSRVAKAPTSAELSELAKCIAQCIARYHGVSAPNSAHRALVARVRRGKGRADAARADARACRAAHRDALATAPEARVRHRRRDLRALRRYNAHHCVHRRSASDQVDPRSTHGQSAPGARTAVAGGPDLARADGRPRQ